MVPCEPTLGEIYLEDALDIMQTHSLHRYVVDWPGLRSSVHGNAGCLQTPADAYPAIRDALSLIGDDHSAFLTPSDTVGDSEYVDMPPIIRLAENLPGSTTRIGYVRVRKAWGSRTNELATTYHRGIERIDTLGTCGWIVDLRNNVGGSMWPMITGVGPILGEGVVGYSAHPDSTLESWSYDDGVARLDGHFRTRVDDPYVLREPGPPVAVLVNFRTASAAEATFIAFRGRPETSSFGTRTAGFSTMNDAFALSDGAILLLTVAVMADRTGRRYSRGVTPDTFSGEWPQTMDPETDVPYRDALEWLELQEPCSAG